MFGRRRKPLARPSLLMFLIDRHIARMNQSLVLYRVHRSGSFTLCEGIVIAWAQEKTTTLGGNRTSPFFMTMQVTLLAIGYSGTSTFSPDMSPCAYDFFAKVKEPLRGMNKK